MVSAIARGDHPEQASAISVLISAHHTGAIQLVASTEVLGEIQRLPPAHQGPHLEVYNALRTLAGSKVTWLDEASTTPSVRTDPLYQHLEPLLSGETDRRHVFQAAKQGVPYFATVDMKTILSRKVAVEAALPIKLGLPSEIASLLSLRSG